MNNLIDRWYPAPGGWFSNGPLSITESLSCSNYSMEWRSVIIGLALVCSKASPFGWNHDLTTKKWQLKISKTVKYVGIHVSFPCHFPNFEFWSQPWNPSESFGHESTGVHAPPEAEAKQVATSTIRRDGMATTTTWTRCPSVQIKLKRKLQCKSVKKMLHSRKLGSMVQIGLSVQAWMSICYVCKKMFCVWFFWGIILNGRKHVVFTQLAILKSRLPVQHKHGQN